MSSHLVILNRDGAPPAAGWIHIVPKGELPNNAAGITQVLDDKSLDSILQNIRTDQQRLGDRWPGVYAGREHFIYDPQQDSAALAWFRTFEKRADGIWAKDDGLTDIGREAVANKRYKFTSFVTDERDLEPIGGNRYRILKIETVGFTNQANGRDLLQPIMNTTTQHTSALTSKQAAEKLSLLTNREMRATGANFDAAWRTVCNREVKLNELARDRVARRQQDQTNREKLPAMRAAAAQLTIIANQAPGRNWSEKWNTACAAHPELVRESRGE